MLLTKHRIVNNIQTNRRGKHPRRFVCTSRDYALAAPVEQESNAVFECRGLCGAEAAALKRDEIHRFVVLPQRWVVERTFGWLDKVRRLWKNCERTLHQSCQMLLFALIAILIRRF
jgi:transposase